MGALIDASVLIAIIASTFLFVGLPLAIIAPASWLTGTGFVLATLLTTGWFLARGAALWIFPHAQGKRIGNVQASVQLEVISNGSRR